MKKKELIDELKSFGVEAPKGATNPELEKLLQDTKEAHRGGDTPDGKSPDGDAPDGDAPDGDAPNGDAPPEEKPQKSVKMEAISPLFEDGKPLSAGDTFFVTNERAKALKSVAKIV